jgi:hypothetical protein
VIPAVARRLEGTTPTTKARASEPCLHQGEILKLGPLPGLDEEGRCRNFARDNDRNEDHAKKNNLFTSIGSMGMSCALMVRVDIGSLLVDVRLAILLICKSAAGNLASLACCIPALFGASHVGFSCSKLPWS